MIAQPPALSALVDESPTGGVDAAHVCAPVGPRGSVKFASAGPALARARVARSMTVRHVAATIGLSLTALLNIEAGVQRGLRADRLCKLLAMLAAAKPLTALEAEDLDLNAGWSLSTLAKPGFDPSRLRSERGLAVMVESGVRADVTGESASELRHRLGDTISENEWATTVRVVDELISVEVDLGYRLIRDGIYLGDQRHAAAVARKHSMRLDDALWCAGVVKLLHQGQIEHLVRGTPLKPEAA